MKFNEKLFELRKEKGYSQEELADKLNVARQTISKWENGTTTPDFDNLIELSKLFEISIDDFVGNDFKKEKLNETQDEQNEENLNIVIDEKEVESKSKKRKVKKIFLSLLFIIIIIGITIFTVKVIERYKILDAISKKMVLYSVFGTEDKRKQEFSFYKSILEQESYRTTKWLMEKSYSKSYNFKKIYYTLDITPNLSGGSPEVVRIEYIDGDDYYDIDVINKTYKKGEYEPENYYLMAGCELDIAILDELSLDSIKSKILLACDFSYEIYIAEGENGYKDYNIMIPGNKDKNSIIVTASATDKCSYISVYITETQNNSVGDSVHKSYSWNADYVEEESIIMPDLTNFTLIE